MHFHLYTWTLVLLFGCLLSSDLLASTTSKCAIGSVVTWVIKINKGFYNFIPVHLRNQQKSFTPFNFHKSGCQFNF